MDGCYGYYRIFCVPKFDAVRAAMKDPAAAEKLAKDPSAAQMLKNISKGGFGRGR